MFAYDYRSSNYQLWEYFNPSSLLIDFCQLIGLAYDCKKASPTVVEGAIKRKGIPAYFDKPRGICFRVSYGLFDWFLGTAFHVWPVAFGLAYELVTGNTIFVYGIPNTR